MLFYQILFTETIFVATFHQRQLQARLECSMTHPEFPFVYDFDGDFLSCQNVATQLDFSEASWKGTTFSGRKSRAVGWLGSAEEDETVPEPMVS